MTYTKLKSKYNMRYCLWALLSFKSLNLNSLGRGLNLVELLKCILTFINVISSYTNLLIKITIKNDTHPPCHIHMTFRFEYKFSHTHHILNFYTFPEVYLNFCILKENMILLKRNRFILMLILYVTIWLP